MRDDIEIRAAIRAAQHLLESGMITEDEIAESCEKNDRHLNISALYDIYVEYIWTLLQEREAQTNDPYEYLVIKRIGRVYQWLRGYVHHI